MKFIIDLLELLESVGEIGLHIGLIVTQSKQRKTTGEETENAHEAERVPMV